MYMYICICTYIHVFCTVGDVISSCIYMYMYIPLFLEHVPEMVEALFQYLTLMRREGPQETLFQECAVCVCVCVCVHGGKTEITIIEMNN